MLDSHHRRAVGAAAAVSLCLWLTGLTGLTGCSNHSTVSEAPAPGTGLPCAVEKVIVKHCQACHSDPPRYGAPMPLVDYESFATTSRVTSGRIAEHVTARIHDDASPMPPSPNARLDAADLATLDAWLSEGAPRAAETCAAKDEADAGTGLSCSPNVVIRPAQPVEVANAASDQYVCYGFESGRTKKHHIVGFAPAIATPAALHHVTLMQSDVPVSPVPGPCSPEAMTSWRPLYGWAPGSGALELPPAAGFPDDPDTHFVVQIHYLNVTGKTLSDRSGFDLCSTETLRENDADVFAFGTMDITIPARSNVERDCSVPVPSDGATTHLFSAFPHMHKLGRSIRATAIPSDGSPPVDLGTVADWSYGSQAWLPIDYTLRPGDTVRTVCDFTNTTDHGVTFGPSASDEMCFSYTMYYPKILASNWNWALPALYSTCK